MLSCVAACWLCLCVGWAVCLDSNKRWLLLLWRAQNDLVLFFYNTPSMSVVARLEQRRVERGSMWNNDPAVTYCDAEPRVGRSQARHIVTGCWVERCTAADRVHHRTTRIFTHSGYITPNEHSTSSELRRGICFILQCWTAPYALAKRTDFHRIGYSTENLKMRGYPPLFSFPLPFPSLLSSLLPTSSSPSLPFLSSPPSLH